MRLLLLLFLFPVLLFVVIIVMLTVPLPAALDDNRNLLAAIIAGILGLVYVGLTCYFVMRWLTDAGSSIDSVLANSGLRFTGRRLFARCYEGSLDGRAATILLTPAFKFQPWRLEVKIAARPEMRIAIGTTTPLLDCRGIPRLSSSGDLGSAVCHVHSEDEDRALQTLDDPVVGEVLKRLLDSLSDTSSWEIYIQPDRVWARIRTYKLREDEVVRQLAGLSELADACERLAQ